MDVGLAPIDVGDRFNETKSDVRLREYAALGIPYIASRSEAYTRTALDTRGLVASTEEEWEESLIELYRNTNFRRWITEQGRLRARLWTTEENAKEWERAYERAGYTRSLAAKAAGISTIKPHVSDYSSNGDRRPVANVRTSRV
jgi:glycosyltransferase involved in cell wall biosynthesis